MRLVQLKNADIRRVALVEEPSLHLLDISSVYEAAQAALQNGQALTSVIDQHLTGESLSYDAVYAEKSEWRLRPPVEHPSDPARCIVSGTGLTHLGSARDRQTMHGMNQHELTDSMRIFQWGLEAGRPPAGTVGVAPEWFYKGNGMILRAHGEPLLIPAYAEDGGEEAEVAGCYLVARNGEIYRLGMAIGNEFSDHVFEKRNYLNLAGSKLRQCSLGPELVVNPEFQSVHGRIRLERNRTGLWSKEIRTGEQEMCHSIRNIEHHHFKFEVHRRPGDIHVHYLGAGLLSFGDGIRLRDGDWMEIQFDGFGRPLGNLVEVAASSMLNPIDVHPLC